MCNRLHFKSQNDAQNVRALLVLRGYSVQLLRSGCVYQGGLILELGESAFVFATQIAEVFNMECRVEM